MQKVGPVPTPVPGKLWVPVWSLEDSITPESNKSSEELVLDKMKGPTGKLPAKRQKVDLKAVVGSQHSAASFLLSGYC